MRPYEVMVILDTEIEEDAQFATIEKTKQVLTDGGAVVNRVDDWGKRTLAYKIRHKDTGRYVLFEVTGPPSSVQELDRVLRLDKDAVLRHKVIRIPEEVAGRRPAGPPEKVTRAPERPERPDRSERR